MKSTGKKNIFKTNLLLFAGLGVALSLTYFFIEKREIDLTIKKDKQYALLPGENETGKLLEILGDHLEMSKIKDSFYFKDQNIPIDSEKLDKYFYYLTKLKIKEEIKISEINLPLNTFIPDQNPSLDFVFEKKILQFIIGNKINYSQDFYLQVIETDKSLSQQSSRLFVIHDDAPIDGLYAEDESEHSDHKYLRAKGLFLMPNNFFYDLHVLPHLSVEKKSPVHTIEIKTVRSPLYKIDLKNFTTNPRPPGSRSYLKNVFESYLNELKKAKGEDLIDTFETKSLSDKISEIKITTDAEVSKITLWKRYKNFEGPFVQRDNDTFLIKMKKETIPFFTIPLQSFWNKTINQNPNRITLKKNEKSNELADFLIENKKEKMITKLLRYKDSGMEINSERNLKSPALVNLLDVVTRDADYITDLNNEDKSANLATMAQLLIDGKKYYLNKEQDEWQIISLEDRLKWHYSRGVHPHFSINLEDYLK